MTPLQIIHEAGRRGVKLSVSGDKLAVEPVSRCPDFLLSALREHKPALLKLLSLSPDQRPWLHICRQVLAGEFGGADRSTTESLTIGLRSLVAAGITEAIHATERLNSARPHTRTR